MNTNLISKEEVLNSIFIQDNYEYFTEVLKKACELEIISEKEISELTLICFNSIVEKVQEFIEDNGYLDCKEKEQLIKNYIYIFNLYLSNLLPSEVINKIKNEKISFIVTSALNWYEKSNIESYNKVNEAEKLFIKLNFMPSVRFCKVLKRMYKIFSSNIIDYDFKETEIISLVSLIEDIEFNIEDSAYTDMCGCSLTNINFEKYLKTASLMKIEYDFLNNFDVCNIKQLISKTDKNIAYHEVIDGKEKTFLFKNYIQNLTITVFKQFLISTTYHDEKDEFLSLNEVDAKMIILEIFNGFFDVQELYDNIEKIDWYHNLNDEVKDIFNNLKNQINRDIEKIKDDYINNLFYF